MKNGWQHAVIKTKTYETNTNSNYHFYFNFLSIKQDK